MDAVSWRSLFGKSWVWVRSCTGQLFSRREAVRVLNFLRNECQVTDGSKAAALRGEVRSAAPPPPTGMELRRLRRTEMSIGNF